MTATDGAAPHQRVCETPGCRLAGEYRAPRARDRLNEYRWFCLEHVREYNKKWDYYAGLGAEQIEAHIRADTTWRRPVWPLGAPDKSAKANKPRRETCNRRTMETSSPGRWPWLLVMERRDDESLQETTGCQ